MLNADTLGGEMARVSVLLILGLFVRLDHLHVGFVAGQHGVHGRLHLSKCNVT